MNGEPPTIRELIQTFIDQGFTDDEIVDALQDDFPIPSRETVYPRMYIARRLRETIGMMRGPRRHPSREEILEARRLDKQRGGTGSEDNVAKALAWSASTIRTLRQRYGLVPWPKEEPTD